MTRSRAARLCAAAFGAALSFAACGEDEERVPDVAAGATAGTAGTAGEGGARADGAASGNDAGGSAGESGAGSGGTAGAAGVIGVAERRPFVVYPPSPYPEENPDSDAKAMLGKILFWEEQMGGDNTVACGTCHRPGAGGSDPRSSEAAAFLPGPDGELGTADDVHGSLGVVRCDSTGTQIGATTQVTGRKAPTYLDAMFNLRLFWDGRAECTAPDCPTAFAFQDPDNPGTFPIRTGAALENQAVGPPLSDVEMACEGASWSAIHDELATALPLALAYDIPAAMAEFIGEHGNSYPAMFAAAFADEQTSGPSDEINTRRIAFAIATHERRLRSDQTPWDRWNEGDDDALTAEQLRGFELFMGKAQCELCHRLPMFADGSFHFIGFHKPEWDLGRSAVNAFGTPGAMRTPTLRNTGLREASGLLHRGAGVGSSMVDLVELYDVGGLVDDPDVTAVPIDATIEPLNMTDAEKADLVDFLRHALDDPRVAAESAPFDRPRLSSE
jgi:cytochrome c peroxidase